MTRPTDPLYGNQWHLAKIGDLERVWDYYTGNNVTVAVYDDGVEAGHEDLNDNYVPTGSFTYGGTTYTSTPLSASDGHGTSVAGLIAAEANNGLGGVGVAWGANIASLNFLEQVQLAADSVVLAALNNAANFDVMNNSWGYAPYYSSYQSLAQSGSWANDLNVAFATVSADGRGGLGTIVVQSAGNEFLNANGDGMHASRFVVSVGAVDRYGNITDYSNRGACILVTAPDAAYTTDRTGNAGFNASDTSEPTGPDSLSNTNYTSVFGGTSASAPVVSGVVALMLEANPNLGWRDIHNILALSASHTGSALNAGPSGFEVFGWKTANTGTWNGGGTAFSADYGFGLVNALAAVSMAEVWTIIHGTPQTSANEFSASASFNGSVFIPDNGSAFAQVSFAGDITVETVMVTVSLTHSYAPDLQLTLIAPDGSEYVIMADGSEMPDMSLGFTWTFGIEGARGLSSTGTWQLRVDDQVAADVGTITGFSVDIFGSAPSAPKVHTFTDDYLMFRSAEPGRSNIMSSSTGDWLNFAGVSGDIVMSLTAGQTISVNGQSWATLDAASTFSRLAAGSGDDIIRSGTGSKLIMLGLGNDFLLAGDAVGNFAGGHGADTISYYYAPGGVGIDLLTNALSGSWAADDVISGFENAIGSNTGNDTISGTQGANLIYGYGGNDLVYNRNGDDHVDLGDGNDFVLAGNGADTLIGGNGTDNVSYYYSVGGVSVDLASNAVSGGWAANDTISEFENIVGSSLYSDTLKGTNGDNILRGYAGNDLMYDRAGNDLVDLGDGNDYVLVGGGADTLVGGAGIDNISYYYSTGGVRVDLASNVLAGGWAADDAISGFERIVGSNAGNDTIFGGNDDNVIKTYGGNDSVFDRAGNDLVDLGDGHDLITVGGGQDNIAGGNGIDEISYFYSSAGVSVDLATNALSGGWAADDLISGFERVSGSNTGGDVLAGSASDNILRGNGGNDLLAGRAGNDYLDGGAGTDTLTGGTGADVFIFRRGYGADRANDFVLAENDMLFLDDNLWSGPLTASEIVTTYAQDIGSSVILDFGGGNVLTLAGLASTAGLDAQITII